MKKVEFYQLNNKGKMEYYSKRRNLCLFGKYASVITPFIAIFAAKFNEFIELTDGQTIKLTIGCILALIVGAISVWKEVKEDTKKISGAMGWGMALLFIWLFEAVINDLFLIVGCEFLGQCAAAGLDLYGKKCVQEKNAYRELARKEGLIK